MHIYIVTLLRKELTGTTNQQHHTLMGTIFSPVYISCPSYDLNSVSCVYNNRQLNQQSEKHATKNTSVKK